MIATEDIVIDAITATEDCQPTADEQTPVEEIDFSDDGVDFDAIRDPGDFDFSGESAPTGELPKLKCVQNYRVIEKMTA